MVNCQWAQWAWSVATHASVAVWLCGSLAGAVGCFLEVSEVVPGRPTTTGILILKAQRRCRRQASQHDHIVTSASLIWQGLHARCLISFGRISCLAYPTPYPVHLQPLATCIRGYGHRLGMADGKLSHYYAQYCTRCGTAWHQPAQGSFHHHGMAGFGCTVRRFPGMRPCRFMVRCATHDQWGVWKRSAK